MIPVLLFPQFDPVIVHIGPFGIRWYALAYIAGLVLGWRLRGRAWPHPFFRRDTRAPIYPVTRVMALVANSSPTIPETKMKGMSGDSRRASVIAVRPR